jgi:hypothetical protein
LTSVQTISTEQAAKQEGSCLKRFLGDHLPGFVAGAGTVAGAVEVSAGAVAVAGGMSTAGPAAASCCSRVLPGCRFDKSPTSDEMSASSRVMPAKARR